MEYSGEYLVRLARKTIQTYLKNHEKIGVPSDAPKDLFDKLGVFVTLNKRRNEVRDLRGCIGRIQSQKSLIQSTIDSAIDAAVNDPRFPAVTLDELDDITIEVTILTPPKLIKVEKPQEYLNKIIVGKHGLIAEKGFFRGLLLPQVPVEQGWDVHQFLDYTCMKAYLPPDAWTDLETRIYQFEGIIYAEESPKGKIIKKEIH